ncbi:major inner capsid protein sigma 1 [Baboon orthoreovirus]|uniref:Major inner capsid protein sigma 1 n=1 Tax=Baboon orthoreovirus TaxID=75888 RepID=O72462_9REOV|nr:major inner capsid protein sigma 1 [Baboon orthoreovirus]AAC18124.1 major inner capsid protein sigma 1 [Baboon orthoreovirus]
MARAHYPYVTGLWSEPVIPFQKSQINHLLRSSNSVWQDATLSKTWPVIRSRVYTREIPCAGSVLYQRNLLYSSFVPILLIDKDAWKEYQFQDTTWTGPEGKNLVRRTPYQEMVEYDPQPARYYDVHEYRTWQRQLLLLQRIYPQLMVSNMLNLSQFGPITYLDTDARMLEPLVLNILTTWIGKSFEEIAIKLLQTINNHALVADSNNDLALRLINTIFWLSSAGILNQNRTIRGFFFLTKRRGVSEESFILNYNHHGERVNLEGYKYGFFAIRSPDWNRYLSYSLSAGLSAMVLSNRSPKLLSNNDVNDSYTSLPHLTGPLGDRVYYISSSVLADEYIDTQYIIGQISGKERDQMILNKDVEYDRSRAYLTAVLDEDDELQIARRIKPFNEVDWLPGESRIGIHGLELLINQS